MSIISWFHREYRNQYENGTRYLAHVENNLILCSIDGTIFHHVTCHPMLRKNSNLGKPRRIEKIIRSSQLRLQVGRTLVSLCKLRIAKSTFFLWIIVGQKLYHSAWVICDDPRVGPLRRLVIGGGNILFTKSIAR